MFVKKFVHNYVLLYDDLIIHKYKKKVHYCLNLILLFLMFITQVNVIMYLSLSKYFPKLIKISRILLNKLVKTTTNSTLKNKFINFENDSRFIK